MSQAGIVVRLAIRELWITFRLLAMLVLFVSAGAVAALLPASPSVAFTRVAGVMAAATVLSAVLAAWSLADERTSGRSGWLVTRSISRGTYLVGWFWAMATVAVVGIGAAAVLAGLAVVPITPGIRPGELAAAFGSAAGTVAAALALGLVIGAVARPLLAALLTLLICLGIAAAALLVSGAEEWHAYGVLTRTPLPGSIVPAALRVGGIALVVTAVLLTAARAAMERAEL